MFTMRGNAPVARISNGFSVSVNLSRDRLCLRPWNYVAVGRGADDEPYSHSLASQFADNNLMDMSVLSVFGMVAREQFLEYDQGMHKYFGRYIQEPYLYKVDNVLLLGTAHIAPLWSIPLIFRTLMTSQDKLYLENYVVLDCPSEELGTISWYSYASSRIKTIEDLSWFEHLSAKTQNILTYFVPLDDMQTLSKIGVMHSWYRNFQTSCSQTFPDPYQYTGMDSDLAIHYYGRSEGLESGHDVLQTAKKLDMTMEILLEKCISSTLKKVKDVVASYFNKDPKAIMQLSNEEGGLEDLIEDRTLNWMEKINAIITSGEKAVIAVGVGHLFGENGVLYQLFKTGYQVLSLKRDGVTKIVISEYMSISEMLAGEVSGDIEGEAGLLGIADEACVSAE